MRTILLVFVFVLSTTALFGQKRALFDNSHAETAGNADWVIDDNQPVPSPAQSGITQSTAQTYWTGAISAWGVDLVKRGFTVATLTSTYGITYGNTSNAYDLANYDLFVVCEPNTRFTAAEKTAILNFVSNGGGLMMVSDHNGSDRNSDGWDSPMIWNDLGSDTYFGIHFQSTSETNNNISQVATNIATSPNDTIIHGGDGDAASISYHNGTTMNILTANNPTAAGHIWMNGAAQGTTQVMAATARYGLGKVAAVGDSSPADDGSAEPGNSSIFNGWGEVGATDSIVFLNMSLWLTTPSGPSVPPAPVLIAPSNGATSIIPPVNFSWHSSSTATGYQFDLSTSGSFSSILYTDSTLTDTTKSYASLNYSSTYYWRVRAKNASGWGSYSSGSSFTTLAPPSAPSLSSPSNGAAGQPTSITFFWRSVSSVTNYQFDLSASNTFSSILYSDSTLTDTSKLFSGLSISSTYYWRVRAKNAAGWGAYGATWSFSTITPPASPNLSSPSNGAVNVPVSTTFIWRSASSSTGYQIDLSNSNSFATILFTDSTLTDTTRPYSGLVMGSTYYWRVRAKNAAGWGSYSAGWSFTTVTPPAAPALMSPSDGSSTVVTPMTFVWHAAISSTNYELDLSNAGDFSSLLYTDSTITDTAKFYSSLSPGTSYYWRVRGKNSAGWGPFSSTSSFSTIPLPPQVTLLQPADAAYRILNNAPLVWNRASTATNYELDLSTSSSFFTYLVSDTTRTDTTSALPALAPGTLCYWRVRAKNQFGWGPFSQTFSFQTMSLPQAVAPIQPDSAAAAIPIPVAIVWHADSVAASYELDVSVSPSFATFVLQDSTLTDTSYVNGTLAPNTLYYWRVRAKNAQGWGPFGSAWSFTTWNAPAQVQLVSPTDDAGQLPIPVVLQWNSGSTQTFAAGNAKNSRALAPTVGPLTYELNVAVASDFSQMVVDDSTIIDTSRTIDSLLLGHAYFWRVRAVNQVGWGEWSVVRHFMTYDVPAVVQLLKPDDGTTIKADTVHFTWNISANATGYEFDCSFSPAFDSLVVGDSTLVDTTRELGGIDTGKVYYWRVRAHDAAGWSAWSTVRSFQRSIVQSVSSGVNAGWNIVSLPVDPADGRKSVLFPTSTSAAFAYSGSYATKDTLATLAGYWLRFDAGAPVTMTGFPLATDTIQLEAGWNLIGAFGVPTPGVLLATSPSGILTSRFFGYTNGYIAADTLQPMRGYWIKAAQPGSLTIGPSAATRATAATQSVDQTNWNRLGISDRSGRSWTLFAGIAGSNANSSSFALPPMPPEGAADVRFGTNSSAAEFAGPSPSTVAIHLEGLEYPVRMEWNGIANGEYVLNVDGRRYEMRNSVPIELHAAPVRIELAHAAEGVPKAFTLEQNFPNPFNPSTTIRYGLPVDGNVKIDVMNVLGEIVAHLTAGMQAAGYHEAVWDAGAFASGIYYYAITVTAIAGGNQQYHAVEKMMLLK